MKAAERLKQFLDGINDYIDTGNTFQSTFRDSFSVSAWIKLTDGQPSVENVIFGARGSSGRFYFRILTGSGSGKLNVYLNTGSGVLAFSLAFLLSTFFSFST